MPEPGELRTEPAALPRDAFSGPAEDVPAEKADGRIAAGRLAPDYANPWSMVYRSLIRGDGVDQTPPDTTANGPGWLPPSSQGFFMP